jgi:hypothetical protein
MFMSAETTNGRVAVITGASSGIGAATETVLPFTTYAMSGIGAVPDDYRRACKGARIGQGLAVRARRSAAPGPAVDAWLRRTSLRT